jgi:hypothetical protein
MSSGADTCTLGVDTDAYLDATRREPAMGRGSSMEGEDELVEDIPELSGLDSLSSRSRLLLGGLGFGSGSSPTHASS